MAINSIHTSKMAVYVSLIALGSLPASADIILDPDPITGVIGLQGETFSNGNITLNGTQGSRASDSFSSDGMFSLTVEPNETFHLSGYLFNFQGLNSSRLGFQFYNLPALSTDEVRELDLQKASGRIQPEVSIAGGEWISIQLNTLSDYTAYPNERYQGFIYTTTNIANALQPFPVMDDVTVTGIAVVEIPDGQSGTCTVSVSLSNKLVSVLKDETSLAEWVLDPNSISCPSSDTGILNGSINLQGLDGNNSEVQLSSHGLRTFDGRNNAYSYFYENGPYEISELPVGDYRAYLWTRFQSPYGLLDSSEVGTFVISANEATEFNLNLHLGTLHTLPALVGPWGFADTSSSSFYWKETTNYPSAYALDSKGTSEERFDYVLSEGVWTPYNLHLNFYNTDTPNTYRTNGYTRITLPQIDEVIVNEGEYLTSNLTPINTSLADIKFQVAQQDGQPTATIGRVVVSGNSIQPLPSQDTPYYNTYISTTGQIVNGGAPVTEMNVRVYGVPGEYNLTAVGDGTDGRTYRANFTLNLGTPQNTEVGTDVEQSYEGESGTVTELTFDSVVGAGETTVSELSIGPKAPTGFVVYSVGQTQPLYFDIITSAVFEGNVEVCMTYDDENLTQGSESQLELGHYICDEDNANCTWEMITSDGYPDTEQNLLCGLTDSFSLFAVLEDEYIDTDLDGVEDELDNCPTTPNADQNDLDSDGIGDACESDRDGDGIIDDLDLCPDFASDNNFDLDGDGVGDPCDNDVDGDTVMDTQDNCPLVSNLSQVDFDSDGVGDECDVDDDGDNVNDSADNCPGTSTGEQTDSAGCSSTQLFELHCPSEGDYRNHGQYVSCVSKEAERQLDEGMLNNSEKGIIVSSAAKSDIGKN